MTEQGHTQSFDDLQQANAALQQELNAAQVEIDHLQAQLVELKNQRDALNEELSLEREKHFQLLRLRRNWLQSVVRIVLRSLGFTKER